MRPASKFAYWNVDAKHSLVSQGYVHRVTQLFGTDVSIVISVALHVVFSTAYPRINELTRATWAFSTPEVQAWRACHQWLSPYLQPRCLSRYLLGIRPLHLE
ncbi:hypothetical protein EV424DRAFT_833757 [Suillus variegatus]|nr:hypothetical protein EV424DRAFT_833757 [Suillus variegatus]